MATRLQPPRPTASMTPRQRERREAVVAAAVALVQERGVDDLQMREVSERSGVALATMYRYFTSKDHLAAVAFLDWAGRLERRVSDPGADLRPPAERLVEVLRVGIRPFQRQPNFARLMIYVSASRDPFASETYLQLGTIIRGTLARAIPEVAPEVREPALQALGSVWYHSLVEWISGRINIAEVQTRIENAARLLLRP